MVETLQVQCTSCGEEIAQEQIAAQVEQWTRLARWIDSARA
jgi:hypothetical protein